MNIPSVHIQTEGGTLNVSMSSLEQLWFFRIYLLLTTEREG